MSPAAALLSALAACGAPMTSQSTASPERLAPAPPELLVLGATPAGSSPAARKSLEDASHAEARFDRAASAYGAGDYRLAAREFMAAADGFAAPPDSTAAEIFTRNRAACFRNAVSAFRMAGNLDEAEQALRAARVRHATDAPLLDELLASSRRNR